MARALISTPDGHALCHAIAWQDGGSPESDLQRLSCGGQQGTYRMHGVELTSSALWDASQRRRCTTSIQVWTGG